MRVSEAFPSKYVAAEDLNGADVPVTIDRVAIEEVGDEQNKEHKPVLYFAGMQKGLVLNKTNATTIAGLYGDEMDHWAGKAITVYPTETEFRGKMTRCIRVRLDAPTGLPQQQPAQPPPPPVQSGVSF